MNKKLFKDWTLYEKSLFFFSIVLILTTGIYFKSNIITMMAAITGITCSLLQAKGQVASQFVGLFSVSFYSILSYNNKLYGEMLVYLLIMLPLFVMGIISWLNNKDIETKLVKPHELTKKDWIILIIISIILFVSLYFLLEFFNSAQLLVSVLSMVTILLATYLVARRSKYGFLFYIANDITLLILWGVPILNGSIVLIPFLFEPIINFINDNYGWFNWNRKLHKNII